MSEKCKYCNYVSKCSQFCEYNSVVCKLHRSFPKIVAKPYEELVEENQQLKEQNKLEFNDYLKFRKEQEDRHLEETNKLIKEKCRLKQQLKQRDEVIKEAIKRTNKIKNLGFDTIAKREILDILKKYKGDSNDN